MTTKKPKRKKEISKRQAEIILWKKGILKWKLHDIQQIMYDQIKNGEQEKYTLLCARRLGKSFLLCILAAETCIQQKNAIVKYICPKQKMVKTIIRPIMRDIFADAPPEVTPEWKENEKVYVFPNGSQIQLAGSDNGNHENIRGGYSHLWVVDEAGFCDEVDYVVNSVLSPTADTTDGIGILASTPSKSPEHPFITEFVEAADMEGNLLKYIINDNPMMTPEKIAKIESRYVGGRGNPEFRREYLCEIVRDTESVVLPEFTNTIQEEIIKEWTKPKYFDSYMAMDIGGKDYTVVLFAYYDFLNNKVIIEDELVIREKQNTFDIANGIKQKCQTLWDEKPVYLSFADNNNIILLNDLQMNHGLNFIPTRKDNKEAAINNVRLKIQNREIIINPRCKTLIAHMKHATWAKKNANKGYKEFNRSVDYGHYDAVDALVYLIRNVVYMKNPFPSNYSGMSSDNHYIRNDSASEKYKSLTDQYKVRKSIKINK